MCVYIRTDDKSTPKVRPFDISSLENRLSAIQTQNFLLANHLFY